VQLLRYIVRRVGISLVTLYVVVTATFFLMNMMPGDPFIGNKAVPKAIKDNLYAKYGLDQPILTRYAIYMKNILKGDLGLSMTYKNRRVIDIIKQNFPVSADLGIRSLIFGLSGGILLGILAALNHNKGWDSVSIIIAVIGVSLPAFVIGYIVQFLLAVKLNDLIEFLFHVKVKIFPIARWGTFAHTILPSFTLGLGSLAIVSRMMRTSMLDVLNQDYIKTAKAKGLSMFQVTLKHTIRNAILPVVTILGPLTAAILTGTFIVERVFAIPGLGKHFIQSIQMYDYTMIMGLTIFYCAFYVIMIMVMDIAYGLIDPRIRLSKGKA